MTTGSSSSTTTTVHINEFDVLTGRDRLAFGHPGNRHFRQLCARYRDAYQAAHKRSVKTDIIQSIVAQVKERDGRFLTLQDSVEANGVGGNLSSTSSSHGYITWIEMDAAATHQKVSHSLRSGKIRSRSDESALPSSPSSSSSLPSLAALSKSSLSSSMSTLSASSSSLSYTLSSSLPQLVLPTRHNNRLRDQGLRNSVWDMHEFLSQSCPNLGGGAAGAHESILQDLARPFADVHIFDEVPPPVVEDCESVSVASSQEGEEEAEEDEGPLGPLEECIISTTSRDSLCLFDAMLRDSFALPGMPRMSFYGAADLGDDMVEV